MQPRTRSGPCRCGLSDGRGERLGRSLMRIYVGIGLGPLLTLFGLLGSGPKVRVLLYVISMSEETFTVQARGIIFCNYKLVSSVDLLFNLPELRMMSFALDSNLQTPRNLTGTSSHAEKNMEAGDNPPDTQNLIE
ncbi:hypothetical protein Tco_0172926 [Tanacetum coccineum]